MAAFRILPDGSVQWTTTTPEEAVVATRAQAQFGDRELLDVLKAPISRWAEQFRVQDDLAWRKAYRAATKAQQHNADTAIGWVDPAATPV